MPLILLRVKRVTDVGAEFLHVLEVDEVGHVDGGEAVIFCWDAKEVNELFDYFILVRWVQGKEVLTLGGENIFLAVFGYRRLS